MSPQYTYTDTNGNTGTNTNKIQGKTHTFQISNLGPATASLCAKYWFTVHTRECWFTNSQMVANLYKYTDANTYKIQTQIKVYKNTKCKYI